MSDSPAHSVVKVPVNVVVRVVDLAAALLHSAHDFVQGVVSDVSDPFRGSAS